MKTILITILIIGFSFSTQAQTPRKEKLKKRYELIRKSFYTDKKEEIKKLERKVNKLNKELADKIKLTSFKPKKYKVCTGS